MWQNQARRSLELYEAGSVATIVKGNDSFAWLRQLMNWQRELVDPNEFIDSVKVDLFADEVYVFTPGGDVLELPRGATAVDFAFAIHTQVGETCIGAKVNGRLIPLKTELRNGDTIEILTRKGQKPNKDWLEFVKTTRARTKIRAYLRMLERERSLQIGTELLEKEFKKVRGVFIKVRQKQSHRKSLRGHQAWQCRRCDYPRWIRTNGSTGCCTKSTARRCLSKTSGKTSHQKSLGPTDRSRGASFLIWSDYRWH